MQGVMEARQLQAAKAETLRQLGAAQALMCRRASQLARLQLLSQCWRALVLHTMGSQLLADRRRFRLLLQDPACAPSGGGTEAGGGQGGKGAAGGAGVLPAAPEELAPLPPGMQRAVSNNGP